MADTRLLAVLGSAAVLLVGGCAYDDHPPGAYAAVGVGYDGFYDDYYGPFYDGYWGGDGAFYYRDAAGHPFHRDTGGHFRRSAATGFHPVHGHRGP